MKGVLISIRPRWCERIANGDKTIEVRKNRPKLETPFKCYIYQTKEGWGYPTLRSLGKYILLENLEVGKGRVLGEFICDRIEEIGVGNSERISKSSCVTIEDMWKYARPKSMFDLKAWHISELKIYEEPKELCEFFYPCKKQEYPYCFDCEHGLRKDEKRPMDGMRHFDVSCGNWVKRAPQSWCYVEEMIRS